MSKELRDKLVEVRDSLDEVAELSRAEENVSLAESLEDFVDRIGKDINV
jgi:hypothetical protein